MYMSLSFHHSLHQYVFSLSICRSFEVTLFTNVYVFLRQEVIDGNNSSFLVYFFFQRFVYVVLYIPNIIDLELGEFMGRQEKFGKILSEKNAQDILDIGRDLEIDRFPTPFWILFNGMNEILSYTPCYVGDKECSLIESLRPCFKFMFRC